MNVNWNKKTVSISAGELSSWTSENIRVQESTTSSVHAMQEGTQWHNRLRKRATEEYGDSVSFETKISGEYLHAGWTFQIDGRIDQWIHISEQWTIREIKTISASLPSTEFWLRLRYPEYFSQIGCYFFLLSTQLQPGQSLTANLLFIERKTGFEQSLLLQDDDLESWKTAVERLTQYLERRRGSLLFWQRQPLSPLYPEWRPEQSLLLQARDKLYPNSHTIALEAPTGAGKTGLLWQWGLNDLRSGKADRLLYLTGRSSGQWQAAECLQRAIPQVQAESGLLWHLQRPRQEHCEHHTWQCSQTLPSFQSLLRELPSLLQSGTIPLNAWRQMAGRNSYCAYELSRKIAPISPIWIADYNYFLGRSSNRILRTDFDPARTVLIIDEAHNLESRLLDHWSVEWNAAEIQNLLPHLHRIHASRSFITSWEQWGKYLGDLSGEALLTAESIQQAESLLFELSQRAQSENWEWDHIPGELADRLWQLRDHATLLTPGQVSWDWIWWSPRQGVLQCTPLEIHSWLSSELQRYQKVYLASAFLPKELPLIPNAPCLRAESPWREESYRVALDLRVNTRYENRREGLAALAQSLIDLCQTDPNPVVAFFPSYRYAESVLTYVQTLAPEYPVVCQPTGMDAQGQREFLEGSLLTARAIFLVMGSFASEGIDLLGGRVTSAMVVSPALPEVNVLREARTLHQNEQKPGSGFTHYYLEPGCSRVQQALGRLVRNPQHRARVVLACERFGQPQYQRALDPLFANGTPIRNTQQWQEWLTCKGL